MKTVILTSRMDTHDKDEFDVRTPKNFGNENGIYDNIVKNLKKRDLLTYIASDESAYEITDMYASLVFKSFDLTLPFGEYVVLDGRNMDKAGEIVAKSDLIILGGGHVPTERKFFERIGLREKLESFDGVIIGISAGSMMSAGWVYCPPELEGEGLDKNFVRYFRGLGLTDLNIFPHYNDMIDFVLDGKRMMEDIIYPDTFNTPVLALPDGSYVLIKKGEEPKVFGTAYYIKDGKIE